jgi:hypothetical protein
MAGILRPLGLIGDPLGPTRYLAGDGFLHGIVFLGCSPRIELSPPPGAMTNSFDFCHVHIPQPSIDPQLHAGRNLKAPRCPGCRKPFAGRDEIRKAAIQIMLPRPCAACGRSAAPIELDWRKSACISRFIVNIHDVHESEAVPTPGLLAGMKNATDATWAYCYIDD